ncbi:polyprenyl synthetase family protein [Leucobacter zeae]|nr:polyprenyl synthetase family protein [Leucobacter zeae]
MTLTQLREPRTSDPIASEISDAIARVLEPRAHRAAAQGTHVLELWRLAVQCLRGGKMLRPRLLMGAFDAIAGARDGLALRRHAALDLAAALEVLHFSFLLHDDLIDEDLLRRGSPNLIGHLASGRGPRTAFADADPRETRRLHWARSSALLVGDLMLTIAHQVFARVHLPEHARIRVLDLLDTAVSETVAGEYSDVGLADGALASDVELVLEMTRMKTATYTFELPLRIAAVLADAPPRLGMLLGDAGRHLGIAFQLQDDLLSAFGRPEAHGKDEFSDFREGKETALIAHARTTAAWPTIEELLGRPEFTAENGRTIQRLLESSGSRACIESMVRDRISAALTILAPEGDPVPPAVSSFILGLVDSIDGRRA